MDSLRKVLAYKGAKAAIKDEPGEPANERDAAFSRSSGRRGRDLVILNRQREPTW
jgi:hypothetical protein